MLARQGSKAFLSYLVLSRYGFTTYKIFQKLYWGIIYFKLLKLELNLKLKLNKTIVVGQVIAGLALSSEAAARKLLTTDVLRYLSVRV